MNSVRVAGAARRRLFPASAPALLCLLVASAAMSYAQSETSEGKTPEQWLEAMHAAFDELGYDGVFMYRGGSEFAMLRIVHLNVDGVKRVRLIHLNGAPREVIRRGDHVVRMVPPNDETLRSGPGTPVGPWGRSFAPRFEVAERHYRVRIDGEDRIAGRRAVHIRLRPSDQNRFGHRLWLDHDTGLLLRSELHDARGNNLEVFQFASVVIGEDISESALEPAPEEGWIRESLTSEDIDEGAADAPVRWHAGWVPDGFVMADAEVSDLRGSGEPVTAMMWSDGLAAFHVFVESSPDGRVSSLVSRDGATVVVTHVVKPPQTGSHLVTVVGEVPTATASRVARSVYYQD